MIYATAPETPDSTMAILPPLTQQYVTLSMHSATLSLGEGVLLTATLGPAASGNYISWQSSNQSVATVKNGYVVALSPGVATITVSYDGPVSQPGRVSDTCTITVTNNQLFEDGMYFIQNVTTQTYLDIKGDYSVEGAQIHLWELTGNDSRKWILEHIGTGYYTIQSYHSSSGMFIGINEDSVNVNGTTVHQYLYPTSYYNQWSFMRTSSGNYAMIPRTGEDYLYALKAVSTSTANGTLTNQSVYTNNTNFQDEWSLTRMLPLSGSEIEYGTSGNWSNATIKAQTNCYSYAINTHQFVFMVNGANQVVGASHIDPGMISYTSIEGYDELPLKLVDATINDFVAKSSMLDVSLSVNMIEAYEECPEGSYKVALFVDPKSDSFDEICDYHWLRQDADGLWSHKRGNGDVTRFDDAGKLIIDPRIADLQYGYYVNARGETGYLDYEFVCFLSITPWDDLNLGNTASSNIIDDRYELLSNTDYDHNNLISYTGYHYEEIMIVTEEIYRGDSLT